MLLGRVIKEKNTGSVNTASVDLERMLMSALLCTAQRMQRMLLSALHDFVVCFAPPKKFVVCSAPPRVCCCLLCMMLLSALHRPKDAEPHNIPPPGRGKRGA